MDISTIEIMITIAIAVMGLMWRSLAKQIETDRTQNAEQHGQHAQEHRQHAQEHREILDLLRTQGERIARIEGREEALDSRAEA